MLSLPRSARLSSSLALFLACGTPESERRDAARPAEASAATASARPAAAPHGDSAAAERADRARIQGKADAPVYLIEVSDFQCPYCKVWHDSTYPVIKRDYVDAGRARLAYVNFPIGSHEQAQPAAEAAMCAGAQGRFWEMHDALFDSQRTWSGSARASAVFDSLAGVAEVDRAAWKECMSRRVMQPSVDADYARAAQAGVNSTPSFFVNGQLLRGAAPTEDFRRVLDAALAAAGGGARK